ncbi:pectate lyase, partial [Staphylococcus warneri]
VKHEQIFIAGNHFDDSTQTLHLEDIKDLTLNQEETFLKIDKINVE